MSLYGEKTLTPPAQPGFYFIEIGKIISVVQVEQDRWGEMSVWIVGSDVDLPLTPQYGGIDFWYPIPIEIPRE